MGRTFFNIVGFYVLIVLADTTIDILHDYLLSDNCLQAHNMNSFKRKSQKSFRNSYLWSNINNSYMTYLF